MKKIFKKWDDAIWLWIFLISVIFILAILKAPKY